MRECLMQKFPSKEIPNLTVLTSAGGVSSQNKVTVSSGIVEMAHVLRFNFSALFIRALFTQTQMLFDQFDICFVKLISLSIKSLAGDVAQQFGEFYPTDYQSCE